ncbi:GntR family transcriptional regulator [Kitasatospora sp. NPDC004240]
MTQANWAPLPAVKSKADLVYDSLRAAIAEGDLKPGERINMDELARNLGVSKIPIREAVKRLEADGLVASRVHSGVTVAKVDAAEMRGVFLAREAIEGLVAGLAAERVTDAQLDELDAVQQEMRAKLGTRSFQKLPELNSRFHQVLSEAAGYRILAELTDQLLLTVRRHRIAAPVDPDNWADVIAEHDAIVTALRSRDPEAATRAAKAHINAQADHEAADQA